MDKLLQLRAPVENDLKQFSELFDEVLVSSNPLLQKVFDHVRQRKGKMMRPTLIMLMARLLGEINERTFRSAVSLELLHTASLIHDDVVDESMERRGMPSVNALFHNKVAVLSGDYVLASSLMQASLVNSPVIISLISRLGRELADGELIQLNNISSSEVSEDVYFDIIRKKTAALFSTCAAVAACSVDAAEEAVGFASTLGELIGICFQIRDDIFDYFDTSGTIGKPTGNDMREGKLTLPAIYAYHRAAGDKRIEQLVQRIKSQEATSEEIHEMIDFSVAQGGIEYAEQRMEELKKGAKFMLSTYPDSPVRGALEAYIDYVSERKS